MSLQNFAVLPIVSVALMTTSVYSSPAYPESAQPVSQETAEVVTEIQEEEMEVNPTQDEEEARETTPEVSPSTLVWSGKIQYTQNEVRLYPAMESICTCESGKQFHEDGTVVRGIVNPLDIGMCQINQKYHGEASLALGFDTFTEVGNIKYSNYLYDQQGAQPWFWSKPCHGQG